MDNLKKPLVLLCMLYAVNVLASDGWQPIAEVSSVQALPQGVEITAGQARVRIVAIAPNVIACATRPTGSFGPIIPLL